MTMVKKARACPVCAEKGRQVDLVSFQVNLVEATYLCPEKSCTYPLGTSNVILIQRSFGELAKRKKAKGNLPSRKKTRLKISTTLPEPKLNPFISTTSIASEVPVLSSLSTHTTQSVHAKPKEKIENVTHEDLQNLFWKNSNALCWLDVVMFLLIKNEVLARQFVTISPEPNSCIYTLWTRYRQCQYQFIAAQLRRKKKSNTVGIETSVGPISVKTGGGDPLSPSVQFEGYVTASGDARGLDSQKTSSVLEAETRAMLETLREEVWSFLQPLLKCVKGTNDSPVFALSLLLNACDTSKKLSNMDYCWKMRCTRCGYNHADRVSKPVVTFPAVPEYFSMTKPCFLRKCFSCGSDKQSMELTFDSLPDVLFIHFVDGLHSATMSDYDFSFRNAEYAVTGLVQYMTNPDHFVAWSRNTRNETWMLYNDLLDDATKFTEESPNFPPSQVHIMMWEKQVPKSGYSAPVKSKKFVRLTAQAKQHPPPKPPPVQRTPLIVPTNTPQELMVQKRLSHLRPSLPPARPVVPKMAFLQPSKPTTEKVSSNKTLSIQQRLEMMRARFSGDKGGRPNLAGPKNTYDAVSTSYTTSTISNQFVSSPSVTTSGLPSGASQTVSSLVEKAKSTNKWLTKGPKGGSYLAAFKPYLKKSLKDQGNTRGAQTFQGYVPKSALKNTAVTSTATVTVQTTSKTTHSQQVINATSKGSSKVTMKMAKEPKASKLVSFFDAEGFRVPASPIAVQSGSKSPVLSSSSQGVKRKLTATASTAKGRNSPKRQKISSSPSVNVTKGKPSSPVPRALFSRDLNSSVPSVTTMVTTSSVLCPPIYQSLVTSSTLLMAAAPGVRFPGPCSSAGPQLSLPSNPRSLTVQQPDFVPPEDQPLDLSPVRRSGEKSTSPVLSNFIDQLCSDLPNELSQLPGATTNDDIFGGSFGLTADEMAVMESLTNSLIPDDLSPTKKN